MPETFPPDAHLREKLFQPIVDRLRIDPQTAKWSCFRFFAVGMTIGVGGLAAAIMTVPLPPGNSPGSIVGMLAFVLFLTIGQVWLQIRRPPAMVLGGGPAIQRIVWVGMCALILALAVMNTVTGSSNAVLGAIVWTMAASWHAGVAGAYVNVCRRPPPPRTDGARKMAFSGV
jgi:sugar (pentulose or hexulose) kinase